MRKASEPLANFDSLQSSYDMHTKTEYIKRTGYSRTPILPVWRYLCLVNTFIHSRLELIEKLKEVLALLKSMLHSASSYGRVV